jgi:hypothetical protein
MDAKLVTIWGSSRKLAENVCYSTLYTLAVTHNITIKKKITVLSFNIAGLDTNWIINFHDEIIKIHLHG